jgi:hypothetical protein
VIKELIKTESDFTRDLMIVVDSVELLPVNRLGHEASSGEAAYKSAAV